jgi:hypothetical protein
LLEYDGKQHFEPVDFFGGEEKFKIQKINDNIKNKYCKLYHIKLVRVSYFDFKNIDIILNKQIKG